MWVRRSRFEVVLSCVALAGCAGHALDIGSNDGGTATGDEPSPSTPDQKSDASFATAATSEVWSGHLQNHQFSDGSDALTMTLDFAADGTVTGSLLLGSGSTLQPPTDPNVGYPPGTSGQVGAVEGFPYTILDGTSSGPHLMFHVAEYEVWAQWCALQTSYLWSPVDAGGTNAPGMNFYGCIPNGGQLFDGQNSCYVLGPNAVLPMLPVDCGKMVLCSGGVCQCSVAGCQVNRNYEGDISLDVDLVLPNTRADGTISGEFGTYDVEFTRTK
jgi:hypothetical protein